MMEYIFVIDDLGKSFKYNALADLRWKTGIRPDHG